jgi:hypothetical protein
MMKNDDNKCGAADGMIGRENLEKNLPPVPLFLP